MVGSLVGNMVERLVGNMVESMVERLIGSLIGNSVERLIGSLVGSLVSMCHEACTGHTVCKQVNRSMKIFSSVR